MTPADKPLKAGAVNPTVPASPSEKETLESIARMSVDDGMPGGPPEFWTSYRYKVKGVPHYTGFAYFPGDLAPASKAVLAQATFLASVSGLKPAWKPVGAQAAVGEFGARGRAFAVDRNRTTDSIETADGHHVVAIPANAPIEQGAVSKTFEILVRSPDSNWTYAGSIPAGVDDSAGCDGGEIYPCEPVKGTFSFVASESAMPDIQVRLEHGARSTTNVLRYSFADARRAYVPRH